MMRRVHGRVSDTIHLFLLIRCANLSCVARTKLLDHSITSYLHTNLFIGIAAVIFGGIFQNNSMISSLEICV